MYPTMRQIQQPHRGVFVVALLGVLVFVVLYYEYQELQKEKDVHVAVWRNWNDVKQIQEERQRVGLGEYGRPADIHSVNHYFQNEIYRSIREFGFNALISSEISPNRSLPDVRHKSCLTKVYRSKLPKVSIIIVHYNEQRSVLWRTLHSILKRTPPELLEEIILIDDFSDPSTTYRELDELACSEISPKIKCMHMEERTGLIRSRLYGAREASGPVLVFLDSQMEVNHNWLPPLLSPIAADNTTCTTPVIDTIKFDTLEYVAGEASRGGFNWKLDYIRLPLSKEENESYSMPHPNPVMSGAVFAIDAAFFWHLGAYDENLKFLGGEQFELSFKIWMCGGTLLEVPCSHVGHLFKDPRFKTKYTNESNTFLAANYKRVAEVWMDDYKRLVYEHNPILNEADVGNLVVQRTLRKHLNCHSFSWFLNNIAPDLMAANPAIEPPDFAFGAIQSMKEPALCLDASRTDIHHQVNTLKTCSLDLRNPLVNQRWRLTYRRNLRHNNLCLDVQSWEKSAPVFLWKCHNQGGNQYWYYDRATKFLIHASKTVQQRCLEADVERQIVFLNSCDTRKMSMRWNFGYVNESAMNSTYVEFAFGKPSPGGKTRLGVKKLFESQEPKTDRALYNKNLTN